MHTLVKTTERTPLLLAAAALVALLLSPAFAYAQSATAAVETDVRANVETNVSVKANAQVRATTTTNARTEISLRERATGKANEELERRIKALRELSVRVSNMRAVSDEMKADLSVRLSAELKNFSDLKAKIGTATDATSLRSAIRTITDSHRGFALMVQVTHIRSAASRVMTVVGNLEAVGSKLERRISDAKTAGSDVARLETTLASFRVHLGEAKVEAEAALSLVAPLADDEGDEAKMRENRKALKEAQTHIRDAHHHVVEAHADAKAIVKGLRSFSTKATATTTVEANVEAQ